MTAHGDRHSAGRVMDDVEANDYVRWQLRGNPSVRGMVTAVGADTVTFCNDYGTSFTMTRAQFAEVCERVPPPTLSEINASVSATWPAAARRALR